MKRQSRLSKTIRPSCRPKLTATAVAKTLPCSPRASHPGIVPKPRPVPRKSTQARMSTWRILLTDHLLRRNSRAHSAPVPCRARRSLPLPRTLNHSANQLKSSKVSIGVYVSEFRYFCANQRNFLTLRVFIILDKLYWVSDAAPPTNIHNAFFFNIDNVSVQ